MTEESNEFVTRREIELRWKAHEKEHYDLGESVKVALDAVDRERTIHAVAHDKEHHSHQREHGLNNLAIDKAEQATDKRFSSVNATREQMSDILRTLATKESVDSLAADKTRRWEENRKEMDRRFEELQRSITNIEKGDVKSEGKELGRAAMVGIIVGAITLATGVLGVLIAVFNLATG